MHPVNLFLLLIHCVVVSPTRSLTHNCNPSKESSRADVYVGGFLVCVWQNVSEYPTSHRHVCTASEKRLRWCD